VRRSFETAALLLLALVSTGGLFACRERGRPDPSIRMAVSHERKTEEAGAQPAASVPTKLVVPPEVTAAFSGVRIGWKDSQSGKEGVLDVPLGGSASIPGSDLEIRSDVFLPSFTMTSEQITSTGIGLENPAARIAVAQEGKEVFAGWIFKRFPDVHPFQHPRFSLRLEGGVPRNKA
jgi:hypothetical protein